MKVYDSIILGYGEPNNAHQQAKYIIRTEHPAFIARLTNPDDDGSLDDSEPPLNQISGLSLVLPSGYVLREFVWLDDYQLSTDDLQLLAGDIDDSLHFILEKIEPIDDIYPSDNEVARVLLSDVDDDESK